jgi:hypothetical protein
MNTVKQEQDARLERVLPPGVQDALGELAGAAKDGLLALSVGLGLGVLGEMMEASYRKLEEDFFPGFPGGWLLEHQGGYCLLRVPNIEDTIISARAGVAIEIPRSEELAYYVACENKQIMAGRVYMGYGDELALLVLEEIVLGKSTIVGL